MNFQRLVTGVIIFIYLFLVGNFCFAQELVPNDLFYNRQWYLPKMNMSQVWGKETGTSNVIIAVIDSGVDIAHPDLHDNIWVNRDEILGDGLDNDHNGYIDDISGWDFIDNVNDPQPKYEKDCLAQKTCMADAIFHGTVVSGVAAAIGNNLIGIAGMSWHSKIMPLRVLDQFGSGNTDEVVKAVNYAVDNGADIINLSFVGDTFDLNLEKALQRAYAAGLVIVAAAGNENIAGQSIDLDKQKMYPVCHQGTDGENIILGVGASDQDDRLSKFSNFGSSCVDIIAPGQDFWGTVLYDAQVASFNQYYDGNFSGTSLAAPIVSGLVALMKSWRPDLTNKQIIDDILNNADNIDAINPGYQGDLGHGLIDPVKIFASISVTITKGNLIIGDNKTVYYYAVDGSRYVFPNQETYFSWYDDFSAVKKISLAELAQIPMGGNVTIRPGTKLIKIVSAPKVYAVDAGGVLRPLADEQVAKKLYGENWAQQVVDISDVFFINYTVGETLTLQSDFDPFIIKNTAVSIDWDKGLLK